jgi:predicted metal-dependent phosphotriesterase family hydrolase
MIPKRRQAGVDEATLRKITVYNPRRLLHSCRRRRV